MKKLILLSFFLLAVSYQSNCNCYAVSNVSSSINTQQSSNWEYLGKVSAKSHSKHLGTEVELYVRVIGQRTFYQVRYEGKSYSVSLGKFSFGDSSIQYNASFTYKDGLFSTTYYFNL